MNDFLQLLSIAAILIFGFCFLPILTIVLVVIGRAIKTVRRWVHEA